MLPVFDGTGGRQTARGLCLPQVSTRSMRPRQSAIGPWDYRFHIVRDGEYPGELDFRSSGVGACRGMEICLNGGRVESVLFCPRSTRLSPSVIAPWD